MGSDDGDNVITITLVDNGLGDDVLTGADGAIVDQGAPGSRAVKLPAFNLLGVLMLFAALVISMTIAVRCGLLK